jgi:hypothetical protein
MANILSDFTKNEYMPGVGGDFYENIFTNWTNWSKSFPFKFIIAEWNGGRNYTATREFVLPIPPQALRMTIPVASTLTPTLEGVVEQSNGAPFRDIMLQGVTGVNILKKNADPAVSQGLSIYGGALFPTADAAVRNMVDQAQNAASYLTNNKKYNLIVDKDVNPVGTGFFQIMSLRNFFEQYLEDKKKNNKLRLVFANYKEEAFYICTATNLQFDRNSQDPLMHTFAISLRAYRRTGTITGPRSATEELATLGARPNTINVYGRMVGTLGAVNDILSSASNALTGIASDVLNNVKGVLGSVNLMVKKTANIPLTVKDFIDSGWDQTLLQLAASVKDIKNSAERFNQLFTASSLLPVGTSSSALKQSSLQFQDVSLDGLALPIDVRNNLNKAIAQNVDQNFIDIDKKRRTVANAVYEISNSLGQSSAVYAEVYKKEFNGVNTPITYNDARILYALNDLMQSLDTIADDALGDGSTMPDTLQYVAGLAQGAGIAFTIPTSKFAVPFPYGFTLERLAQRYLGNANRWHEIATLNGLKAPYVDEVGWSQYLLTNGNGSFVYVPSREYLYVNQTIYLVSNTQRRERRRILRIRKITDNNFELLLSGDPDLSRFVSTDLAKLEGFLPNTVNSQQVIYIPSNDEVQEESFYLDIPNVNTFDPLIQAAGVDLLLASDGDLIITEDGDSPLAFGLQNIVQSVNIAFSTPKNALLQHPEYGAKVLPGTPTGDVRVTELENSVKGVFSDNSLFEGISSLRIYKDGPVLKLTVVAKLKALGANLPLTFILD